MRFARKLVKLVLLVAVIVPIAITYGLPSKPFVSADAPLLVPKLSYGPTVDQLISDQNLQKEMLPVDMRDSPSTPVDGKAGLGFDNNNVDFILDYTSQTTEPNATYSNVGVFTPTKLFLTVYRWTLPSTKETWFYSGENSKGARNVPNGFTWGATFAKSYFNQGQDHIIFALEIPNSYVGPGSDGTYEFYFALGINNSTKGPQFPASGNWNNPISWGVFHTLYQIPEFPGLAFLLTLSVIFGISAMKLTKKRTNVDVQQPENLSESKLVRA